MPANHRSKLLPVLLCCTALVLPGHAFAQALPSGGHVAAGSATIGRPNNGSLTVNQNSQRAVVNWQSFNVGAGSSVNFNQPNSNAAILNRVTGGSGSNVAGSVTANGKVYLVNPNGIQITPSGTIDAKGGFVASTLNVSNSDFMAGKDKFTGSGASKAVTNQGTITTGEGGSVALIGGSASNEGTITAPLGKVALGAGEAATLDVNGDGFLQVAVPSGATDASGKALVSNSGRIEAAGGTVEMKAAAVRDAIRQAVNMSGVIQARSVSGHDGEVVLGDGSGTTIVSGKVDVSGQVQGGRIDVAGLHVELQGASLDASGGDQGGLVRVGGAFQGGRTQDPASAQAQKYVARFGPTRAIASADTTSVDAASSINVSASGANGAGGAAIVWSNLSTIELGAIAARGALSGGAVEVSSHNAVQSVALARIATGRGGSLLLDPKNIVIDDDPGDGSIVFDTTANYAFADDPNGTNTLTLSTQDIMTWLSGGSDLTLQASNDITWNSTHGGAATSATGIGKLTLDAGRSVIFNVVDTQLTFLDGNLTVIANDTAAAGVVDSDRDAGAASISMLADPGAGSGLTAIVNAGYNNSPLAHTTTLIVDLRDGAGNTNHDVGNIAISQAFFSDVTLSAVPAAQIQFYNQIFDVRNLTITGNIQNGQGNELALIADNNANWTNKYTSGISTLDVSTLSFSFGGITGDNLVGRILPGDSDAIRLILQPDTTYTAVYGDSIPTTSHSLTATIDPNSAIPSFASGDDATTIIRSSAFHPTFTQNPGDPVGTYSGTLSVGGSVIRGSVHGSYLVDASTFFATAPTLNITPRPVTVLAVNAGGFIYGQPDGGVAVTLVADESNGGPTGAVGILSGDNAIPVVSFSGISGTQSLTDLGNLQSALSDHAPGGTRTYTVTGLSNSNYMIDTVNSTVTAQSTISPALLTPTLSAGNYTYGSPDPLVTLSGVINGDTVAPVATIAGITGNQTMADQGGGNYGFDAHVAAGSRTYTLLSGLSGDQSYNYTLDTSGTVSAALNIAPKTLTYANSGGNTTSTYGTIANLDLTLSGVLSGDDVSAAAIVTDSNNATVTLAARTPAGSYTVSPNGLSGAQAADYTITNAANFSLTINKLGISFTAPSGTVGYGSTFGGTVSLTGVLSGDDVTAGLGIKQGGGSPAVYDNHANAGTYQTVPILGGAASGNYLVSGSAGSLVVNQLALGYVLHDASVTYGSGAVPGADLTGILFGDDVSATVAVSAPGGYATTTGVGSYGASITGLTGAKAANYVLGAGIGSSTVTVTPKGLSLNSSNSSTTTTYGSATAIQSFVALDGLINLSDNLAIHPVLSITDGQGNTVTASMDTSHLGQTIATVTGKLDAGSYTVSVTGISSNDAGHPASNYSFTPATAPSITVNKATLIASLSDPAYSATYGGAFPIGFGISFTGFASGEAATGRFTMTDAHGNPVALGAGKDFGFGFGSAVPAGTDAGTYNLAVDTTVFDGQGGAKISNYTIVNSPTSTLTINPKALNWTVNNTTSTYGTLAGPVTSLRGIFGSDDVSINDFSLTDSNGNAVAFNDRVMGGSTYTIRAAGLGGAKAADYMLATSGLNVAGTLTVNPKLITWSITDTSDTYGSANALRDMGTVTLNGLLSGDTLGTVTGYYGVNDTPVTIDGTTSAGSYQTYVSAITGSNTMLHDYTIGFVSDNHRGTLTINPAPITVTVADQTIHYGTTFASTDVNLTSGILYNGDQFQVTGFAITNLGVGNVGDYVLTAGVHDLHNYVITVIPGTLHIDPLPLKYSTDSISWDYGSQSDAIAGYQPVVHFQKDETGDSIVLPADYYTTSILRGTTPVTLAARSDAGTYSLVAALTNSNYRLVIADSAPGTLTINPRVVTLQNSSSVYGARPVIGLQNVLDGDAIFLSSETVTGSTGAYLPDVIWNLDGSFRGNPDSLPVDSYSVTGGSLATLAVSGVKLGNYVLAAGATATLSVTPKPITIVSMSRNAVTYGDGAVDHYAANGNNPAFDIPNGYISSIDATGRTVFDGTVTYSGLVVATDAFQITPYMLPFTTLVGAGQRTWLSEGDTPILAAPAGFKCTQVGCMNRNYTLTNPGSVNATVTVNPKVVTYSIANATGVYGSGAPVVVTISGAVPFTRPDGSPVVGIYDNFTFALRTTFAGGTITNDPNVSASGVLVYALTGGGDMPAGNKLLDLAGLTGSLGSNYTLNSNSGTTATITITPKPITYTTAGGTAYSGVGAIAGSLNHLGDYTLTGLLPGDVVGVSLGLYPGDDVNAATAYAAAHPNLLFKLSEAGSLSDGDYLVVVGTLVGPQSGNYSVAGTGNSPGILTSVDLFSDLNGLSFAGTDNAGTNVLNAASAIKAQEKAAGNTVSAATSIDLSAITNDLTNYVAPPTVGTLASIDISNGLQTTPTPDNYLAPPPVTVQQALQLATRASSTDFTTSTDTSTSVSGGCSSSAGCILITPAGVSATGGADAQACAAGGAVCADGSAGYTIKNYVTPTGVSVNDSVGAGVTDTANENCGAGTCTQTAHVDVSVGVSASGGVIMTSNSVDMTESASATAGVTFNASNGVSGEYGSIDSQVGTTIGGVGIGGGASGSFQDGTLSLGVSFSLDVGIGLDVNINVSLNIDAIGDFLNGTNTTYTYFSDPEAAREREQTAIHYVQSAQSLAQRERDFVSDVLSGAYNANPANIAALAQGFKTEQTDMLNEASSAGFSMSRNSNGSFDIKDNKPPATYSQTVHNDGLLDALDL